MVKIAIISDIHANLPALNAVLKDIGSFRPDQVFCLGDLTDAAPWHNEVIELLRSLHIPVIMGNHDERIAFDHPIIPLGKHSPEEQQAREIAINFTKATITAENRDFLASLPRSIRLTFESFTLVLAHGSTRSNEEYLYEQHDADDLTDLLAAQQADVLVVGHTHLSYVRPLSATGKMVINAGSVGRTKEADGLAAYLRLTIKGAHLAEDAFHAEIRKVAYPVGETITAIRNSPVPDFYAEFLQPFLKSFSIQIKKGLL